MPPFLKNNLPYFAAILIFLLISIAFFPSALSGKKVQQHDIVSHQGMSKEVRDYQANTGEVSVWTNSMFGGMPTYQFAAPQRNNVLKYVNLYLMRLGLPAPIGYFFAAFLSFFILMVTLRVRPWLSIVGAIAFGFTTYNFVIFQAGHTSKFMAVAYFPLVIAGVLLAYRKRYVLGAALFGLGLGLNITANHYQMTYYLGFILIGLVIAELISAIRAGALAGFFKASLLLLLATLLGVGSAASKMWTTSEYVKSTIRGPALLKSENPNNKNSKSGLDKDYVFQWSYGIAESLTGIIPGFYGGSSAEPISEGSKFYQDMRRKGVPKKQLTSAPLYWGKMPSTSGPVYFGAIMCFLFVLGLILAENRFKWWLLGVTILAFFLSWGKNFAFFNDLFYYYFPMYDKFRAVSSILVIAQFTIPLLGVLGLSRMISGKVEQKKAVMALMIAAGVTGGLCLLFALLGPSFFDFEGASDSRLSQAGYNVKSLISDRQSMMRKDALRSLVLILLSAGLLWTFVTEKLKNEWIVGGVLGALVLFDLGGIGSRYLNADNFVEKRKYDRNFAERAADKQILRDTDPNFRVLDLSVNTFNNSTTSYHHKTIGGYHAVKLRRYQDLVERQISRNNQQVLNMLNTKYIINQQQQAQQNPGALGNAWFVSNVQKAANHDEEMAGLNNFDPKGTAIVHQQFDNYLGGFGGGNGTGTIQLTEYKPNHLTYASNSSAEQLAVFSEIWYQPGWQAYIDKQPVDHIRSNYVLRAMKVPAGQHSIEFKFEPRSYSLGELISLICSSILFFGLLVFLFLEFRKKKEPITELDAA